MSEMEEQVAAGAVGLLWLVLQETAVLEEGESGEVCSAGVNLISFWAVRDSPT